MNQANQETENKQAINKKRTWRQDKTNIESENKLNLAANKTNEQMQSKMAKISKTDQQFCTIIIYHYPGLVKIVCNQT